MSLIHVLFMQTPKASATMYFTSCLTGLLTVEADVGQGLFGDQGPPRESPQQLCFSHLRGSQA